MPYFVDIVSPLCALSCKRSFLFFEDLDISYTLELEKDKDFKLRRMFFWDNVAQKRFFLLDKNVTLASPKIEYLVEQKTVYIRVR